MSSSRQITAGDVSNALTFIDLASPKYSAVGDGTTDNATGLQSAINDAVSAGYPLVIPPGVFYCSTALSATLGSNNSFVMRGSGSDVSVIKFAAGINGVTINYVGAYNSSHWHDITFTVGGVGAVAVTLNQSGTVPNPANCALTNFTNVTMRGADGYAQSNYWATGILISSVSNVNFDNVVVVGNAAVTSGSTGVNLTANVTNLGVVYNFDGCTFNYVEKGVSYGTYIQGVIIVSSNFTGGTYGLYLPSGTGTDQIVVNSCQFNCTNSGIYDNAGVQLVCIGNTFLIGTNGAYGIHLIISSGALVASNYFQQVGTATGIFGIVDESEAIASTFSGNRFGSNTPAFWFPTGSTTYACVIANNTYFNGAPFSLGTGTKAVTDTPQTFATLPAAGSTFKGWQAFVTDSTVATWGTTITGGGSNNVLAHCNGTNWTVVGI